MLQKALSCSHRSLVVMEMKTSAAVVRTSATALAQGEAEIDRIGQRLRAAGRL